MILVDSSVWIDFFNGVRAPTTDRLARLLTTETLLTGDLILAEVLQGCKTKRDFAAALHLLTIPPVISITNREVAIAAAANYRTLRARGVTVRKTIDTLIATRCIHDGHVLLYADRDFDPFVEHLGLRSAMREG
jgi:predicted nucleic acid-binding protein